MTNFPTSFSGKIIRPEDATYEQARYSFIRKGSPALIVFPTTTDDIALALQYAQENNFAISVRSGGHSGAGLSTNDGGIVIDMTNFNSVEVIDTEKRLVRVGSGALWGNVAEELQKHGLALSSGDTKTVGVGGLTLGGGIGWMVRKFGLAIDSLVSAEIVTAGGQVLQLSEQENSDLFWAIRGGGGNFGIVTHFDFIAQPVTEVTSGMLSFGIENVKKLLTGWRDIMRSAPNELTTMFILLPQFGPEMPPSAMITLCYAGNKDDVEKILKPLRQLGEVKKDAVTQKPYASVLEEAHPPAGMLPVVSNAFIEDLNDECLQAIADLYESDGRIFQIRYLGGEMNKVDKDATAFAHRSAEALIISPAFASPASTEQEKLKLIEPWLSVEKFGKGSYSNFLSELNEESLKQAYPAGTYQRLQKIKQQYDPKNIFCQNCNIKP